MTSGAHTILLVEDDSDTAKSLAELFRMVKWNTIVASTLDEFRTRLGEGGYCLAIHDLEIPASASSIKPHVDAGLLGIQEHRETFPRSSDTGMHYMPLVCMSAFARDHRSSRRSRRAGVDDAVVKPLDDNDEPLIDTLRRLLRESGREDHARCAELTTLARREATLPPPPVAAPAVTPSGGKNHLTITGKLGGKNRTELVVNARTMSMTNFAFLVLLRLIEGRMRGAAALTKKELGAREADNFRGVSVMQTELKPYLAPKTELYTATRGVGYSLTDDVVVDSIDVETLAKHDEVGIARVAASIAKLQRPAARRR